MVFEGFVQWILSEGILYGYIGVFILSFLESSVSVISEDILIIPLLLVNPKTLIPLTLIATTGSVLGAIFGYYIGMKGGRKVLYKFMNKNKIKKMENIYEKHGDKAIIIAAITPVPYKIFSIASGVFRYDIKKFIIYSIIFRFLRFLIINSIIVIFSDIFQNILSYIFYASLIFILLVFVVFRFSNKIKFPVTFPQSFRARLR